MSENESHPHRKILQALIACELAEKNELKDDYAKYNHGIEKAVYSKAHNEDNLVRQLGIKKLFSKHVICQSKKRLIMAVTITNQDIKSNIFTDFFGSFESKSESTIYDDCPEFKHINKCIVHHGSIIPIGHLIDKLNENYELVFTGYCFGAALAAFLAIRVLTHRSLKSTTDKLNKVSFIGFGCPSFVKNEFKTFIEEKHQSRFEFYRHENDFYANFFDLNSHILVDNNNSNSDLKKDIANASYDFYKSVSNQAIIDYLPKMQSYSFSNKFSEKYFVQFGTLIKLNENMDENINQTHDIKAQIIKLGNVADKNLITKIEDYFKYLKSNLNQLTDNVKSKEEKELNQIPIGDDFDLLNSGEWKFHQYYPEFHNKYEFPEKKEHKTAKNEDNKSHYTVVVVELPQETNVQLGVWKSSKNWNTYFCATMSSTNDDSKNPSNVVLSNRINVGDHVDWLIFSCSKEFASKNKLKFEIFTFYNKVSLDASGMLNIIVPNEQEKDNDKAISVYQLAVDLLFVNALIFVYVVEKMTLREENEKKTIEDDNFKDDSDHLIDTFHKMQRYLKRVKIFNDPIKEKEVFFDMYEDYKIVSDLPNEVDWKSNIPCREQFKNALEKPTLKLYLFELLPVIYFLKQAQVSSFENAQPLWTDLTSSYLKYDCQVGLLAFRRAMWYFKNSIEDDLKYDRACKETTEQLYKIEKEEKSSDIENILPYKGFYEKSVKRIYDESQKEMKRIDFGKNNLKEEFLRSMVWNFEIRKTLCENCLIGVTGLKKAGKSSLVEILTGTVKNIASPIDETTEMSAYRISNEVNLLLIDYPHINGDDLFYALQFAKSKFMLDYVFVVIDAQQFGKTGTKDIKEKMLENLIGLGARRFCIIANRFDQFSKELKESKDRKAFVEAEIKNIKTQVSDCLQEFERNKKLVVNNDEYTNNLIIIPTCLNCITCTKENVDLMEEAGVLFVNNLKKKILDLLCEKIHDKDVIEQIEKLKLKKEFEEEKLIINKTCNFKYEIRVPKTAILTHSVKITNDDTIAIEEDDQNVNSLDNLKTILDEKFNLDNSFEIKTNSNNQTITNFEDFFSTECQDFEILKNN